MKTIKLGLLALGFMTIVTGIQVRAKDVQQDEVVMLREQVQQLIDEKAATKRDKECRIEMLPIALAGAFVGFVCAVIIGNLINDFKTFAIPRIIAKSIRESYLVKEALKEAIKEANTTMFKTITYTY